MIKVIGVYYFVIIMTEHDQCSDLESRPFSLFGLKVKFIDLNV